MTVTGTLVAESLTSNATIEVGEVVLQRVRRLLIDTPAVGQPTVWTLIDFACPDELAARLAEQLSAAMLSGPWYTDYATEELKYVVFAGRRFSFPRGDSTANQQAIDYARAVGVPEAQLDWPL